ncbi:MAG: MerR family transcriptional regulator [Chitinophagales bacterium]|nr:MAG: MerR family transcriptional regulator [Chitinophagales bacterium]
MSTYAISDLEKLLGVKAHTLRMWEKRYGLLKSKRTSTNIRYYDDDDLRYMLNVAFLVKHGWKISRVASMSPEEIASKIRELKERVDTGYEFEINRLTAAMIEMDEEQFDRIVSSALLRYGLETAFLKVIYAFFERVGVLWQTGSINPAREHFVSNLIRQKLIVAIDRLMIPDKDTSRRYLLFLPEEEYHEIGLLFAHYLLRARGCHSLYLGQSVPLADLTEVQRIYKAHYFFTIITTAFREQELVDYLHQLVSRFREILLLVAGRPVNELPTGTLPEGVIAFSGPQAVLGFLHQQDTAPHN